MPKQKQQGLAFDDKDLTTTVRLDGKVIGHILCAAFGKGWFYSPKGAAKFKGDVMASRALVKHSLQSPA